ncbi:hypothetical protein D9M68_647710 [compost metagenome]
MEFYMPYISAFMPGVLKGGNRLYFFRNDNFFCYIPNAASFTNKITAYGYRVPFIAHIDHPYSDQEITDT